jgi:hypothetical protein
VPLFHSPEACVESTCPFPMQRTSLQIRRDRKRAASKFSKRRRTLVRRAYDLHKDCDAQVFLIVKKNGKLHVFNSEPSFQDWPPTSDQIVSPFADTSLFCQLIRIQVKSYPLPNIQTSITMEKPAAT